MKNIEILQTSYEGFIIIIFCWIAKANNLLKYEDVSPGFCFLPAPLSFAEETDVQVSQDIVVQPLSRVLLFVTPSSSLLHNLPKFPQIHDSLSQWCYLTISSHGILSNITSQTSIIKKNHYILEVVMLPK